MTEACGRDQTPAAPSAGPAPATTFDIPVGLPAGPPAGAARPLRDQAVNGLNHVLQLCVVTADLLDLQIFLEKGRLQVPPRSASEGSGWTSENPPVAGLYPTPPPPRRHAALSVRKLVSERKLLRNARERSSASGEMVYKSCTNLHEFVRTCTGVHKGQPPPDHTGPRSATDPLTAVHSDPSVTNYLCSSSVKPCPVVCAAQHGTCRLCHPWRPGLSNCRMSCWH